MCVCLCECKTKFRGLTLILKYMVTPVISDDQKKNYISDH